MSNEKKRVFSATGHGIVDLVLDEEQIKFLALREGKLLILTELEEAECILVPPERDTLPNAKTLSEASDVIAAFQALEEVPALYLAKLYDDIRERLVVLSELPDDRYYDLLAAWTLHTYIHEYSPYSPIIVLFAVAARGKSRTGRGLMYLAYRGLTVNSLRESYIFRVAESLHASLFFDISKFERVMERNHCEDMILARFEQDTTIPRVNHPEWGPFRDTKFYTVYGPTLIGTNQALNQILGSRAITIVMPPSRKKFAEAVSPAQTTDLRARCLAFRAMCMQKPLPHVDKPTDGRLGDITQPLVEVVTFVQPTKVRTLLELINKIEEERKDDNSQTVEAEALKALLICASQVSNGRVALETVREVFNEGRNERGQWSAPSFGKLIKSLGLTQGGRHCRTSSGSSAIPWDQEKIELVCRGYGIEPAPSTPPETPELPDPRSETAGKQVPLSLADLEDLDDKRGIIEPDDQG